MVVPSDASPAANPRHWSPARRALDAANAAVLALAATAMAARALATGHSALLGGTSAAVTLYIALVALGAAQFVGALRHRRGRGWTLVRASAFLVALPLAVAATGRAVARRGQQFDGNWTKLVVAAGDARFAVASDTERAEWGVRVAAHALSVGVASPEQLRIPAAWPLPPGIEFAHEPGRGRRLLAWVAGGHTACGWETTPAKDSHDGPMCAPLADGQRGLALVPVERIAVPVPPVVSGDSGGGWLQYRGDAARSGQNAEAGSSAGWRASLTAGSRSTVALAGGLALVGTHGAGTIEAFDAATGAPRWAATLPNWVHQELVSDGRIVAVGFGDNRGSFTGRAPSGGSAFALRTGASLWTAFEGNAVMTSPVIRGDALVYGTSSGTFHKRSLATGAPLGELALPGGLIMGPPLVRGDTLVAALEPHAVCALSIDHFAVLWCAQYPGHEMMGHAGAALIRDTIIATARHQVTLGRLLHLLTHDVSLSQFTNLGRWLLDAGAMGAGQSVMAIRLADGALLWESAPFAPRRRPRGHVSGTATADGATIVVTLPIADRVVAFDRGTMRVRWSVDGGATRGPVLVADGGVYWASEDGELRVADVRTGVMRCRIPVAARFDRAGPTLGGGLLYFATLDAHVVAVPRGALDRCDTASVAAHFR